MNRLTPIAAALVALFAAPLSLHAQQTSASATAAPTSSLKEVVVEGQRDDFNTTTTAITKLPADLHDVPQSVVVVNKALMQSQGATSLSDALRNVADMTIAVFSQIEHPTLDQCQTTLRGLSQAFDAMKGLYLIQKVLYKSQTTMEQLMQELSAIPVSED